MNESAYDSAISDAHTDNNDDVSQMLHEGEAVQRATPHNNFNAVQRLTEIEVRYAGSRGAHTHDR
jgi:hypothetical protein